MVSFCVASEAEAIVPELMALIPPLICGIATLCALACLAVTPFVCGNARTSPTTRPVPTRNPVSAIRRLRIPAHLLLVVLGAFSLSRRRVRRVRPKYGIGPRVCRRDDAFAAVSPNQ